MKRLRAIGDCLYHGSMPPWLECKLYGSVHYSPWSWWYHARVNLVEAIRLALGLPIEDENE